MKNSAVRYGLLGAVAVVFYFVLLYVARKDQFLNPWFQWASMVIYLVFMVKSADEDMRQRGQARDFREMVRSPFVTFLLINLGYWLFYYGLHLYDPSLLYDEMLLEKNALQAQLQAGAGDPDQANRLRERVQELEHLLQTGVKQSLGPVITRMGMGALGGFALAAGIVAIRRK
ncbi:MAG TPA: hypothetical protein PK971_00090 [Saprospiraceae bacterium]|nr:hypothetical protein [Saprospiraceae bacterium]HND86688.1 hypothetical protein [Saprospiraceae bacterium]HNG89810.1 hypothetical protein [Saprospiraceae bacterium]